MPRELDARFMTPSELALITITQVQTAEPGRHNDWVAFYRHWFLAHIRLAQDVPDMLTDADCEEMGLPAGYLQTGLNEKLVDGSAEMMECGCHAAIRMHPVLLHR